MAQVRNRQLTLNWLLVVAAVAPATSACKQRRSMAQENISRSASANGAVVAASAEVKAVVEACQSLGRKSLYRGITQSDAIDYSSTREAGDEFAQPVQPAWYESARFEGGAWQLSLPIHDLPTNMGCLAKIDRMSTSQLLDALGCTQSNSCSGPAQTAGVGGEAGNLSLVEENEEATTPDGRRCEKRGDRIEIWDVKSGLALSDVGDFASMTHCKTALSRLSDASFVEEMRSKHAPSKLPNLAAVGDPGQKSPKAGGSEGFSLTNSGWTWGPCEDSSHNNHLVNCQGRIFTLYSWGPYAKIVHIANNESWSGRLRKAIFSTPSSIATHGYGDYAIRFRLRNDVKFKFISGTDAYSSCSDYLTDSQVETTVLVRYLEMRDSRWRNHTLLDFIICGLGVVHSWSYGKGYHMTEMLHEAEWVAARNSNEYELYVKRPNGSEDVMFPDGLDGHTFSTDKLGSNWNLHKDLPSGIYYNPNFNGHSEAWHFDAGYSNYINEYRAE